jgi:hypothetical protein
VSDAHSVNEDSDRQVDQSDIYKDPRAGMCSVMLSSSNKITPSHKFQDSRVPTAIRGVTPSFCAEVYLYLLATDLGLIRSSQQAVTPTQKQGKPAERAARLSYGLDTCDHWDKSRGDHHSTLDISMFNPCT